MKVSDVAHEYQDVVRAKDLLLVFYRETYPTGRIAERTVFSVEWFDPPRRLHMAAVVPMRADEEAFNAAKEIE